VIRRRLPVLAAFALAALLQTVFLGDAENRIYDGKTRLFSGRADLPVVLVAIDQGSIDFYSRSFNIGFPWPRGFYGRAIRFLKGAGARVIALDMIFSEVNPYGSEEDVQLARAMAGAGNVALPLVFNGNARTVTSVERFALDWAPRLRVPKRPGVQPPIDVLLAPLAVSGNAGERETAASGGVYRQLQHLVGYNGRVYPSFSLAMARVARPDLDLGRIPFRPDGSMKIFFYSPQSFPLYPMSRIIQAQVRTEEGSDPGIDPALFRNKVVIIGGTAPGLLDRRPSPLDADGAGFQLHAAALANFLRDDYIHTPPDWVSYLLLTLMLLGLSWLLNRSLGLVIRALIGLAAVLLVIAANLLLFAWLHVDLPLLLPLVGVALLSTSDVWSRYRKARRERKFIQGAFQNYLSDSLLQQIMENPGGLKLGGEKKPVTIFFSDLAGFTSFSENMEPEELVRVLNLYLERMTAILRDHDGYLDKFEGDAIMAFWGAPVAVEDPAGKAMSAALDCQRALSRFNDEFSTQGLPRLAMRIGVNSGEVIAGNIGAMGRKLNYTVIGDAVNLASRLEGINKPYGTSIICGSRARAEVRADIVFRHLDRVRVKGKVNPEEIFEVVGRAEDVAPERRESILRFEAALERYFVGEFAAAETLFAPLTGSDHASAVFCQRCRYLLENPPEAWDGVWTFHEK
jgi:adenylate cyclase